MGKHKRRGSHSSSSSSSSSDEDKKKKKKNKQQEPPPAYPPPAYPPPPQYNNPQPVQGATTVVLTQPFVNRGGCAFCGGVIREQYTVCGIILLILFFPIGILCCLMMTERRCSSCGR